MNLKSWQKLLYSAGSMGVALSYYAFATHIQIFYVNHLGLKAELFGIGWSLYGLWNAVNDPLAGYLSDRTRTRLGRRIPWILSAFIPLGLFFYLLWVPPAPLVAGGDTPLFVYFMGAVLVFDLMWTIVAMNWTTLFPEMITDEKERATVSGWRQIFGVIGLLIGVALPPVLVGADWSGRATMAVSFAVISVLLIGASMVGSRESKTATTAAQPPFLPALRATFTSRAFRWFLAANLSKELIFSLIAASIPFWATFVLLVHAPVNLAGVELSPELQNSVLLGLAFIMALPGIPIWTAVAKRLGGRRGWQISQITFAVSMVVLFLAKDFYQGAIGTALTGLSLAGLLVFPDLLISDVIDEDELTTGARREGMFFGVNGFIIRFAFSIQGLLAGFILGRTGFIAAADAGVLYPVQPAAAVLGIRVLTAGLPLVASLLTIIFLQFYPLHSQRLMHLRQRQAELRPVPAAAAAD